MAGLLRDKPVLLGEIPRLLDEPLTDSDSQSSVSDADYAQEASDNEENSDKDENVCALPDSELQCAWKRNDSKFRNNKILFTGHSFV
jgi:hypothetical protein